MCVAGARPNFMKVKPVVDALERRGADVVVVHTGQHYDEAMSAVFFEELGLRAPDHWLGAGSGSHAQQTAAVMVGLEPLVTALGPDAIVVFGDVNSTLAAALVAAKACVPLAHVEAGLRSGDRTMPEEVNRIVTDRLSDYLFAPSKDAVANLAAEGVAPGRVHLVGNVMIDTLLSNTGRARDRPIVEDLGLERGGFGLVTLHRPANVDEPGIFKALLGALGTIAASCPLVFPVHPRTAEQLPAGPLPPGLRVVPALSYLDFLALEQAARLVLTDSGGVQEETTVLGVPCLTLRDTTERPLTVTEGTNTVVGRDPERIVAEAARALRDGAPARRPALWDGHAAERIADVLVPS
ncbi:MAG: non-hydrolyzing UDP-N-acetylglucosamine 2-epimerase [Acidimicrobiales bacterium]